MFQSVYTTIKTNIQKSLGKGSGWIIDSVIDHTINISKKQLYKIAKIIRPSNKKLINIQNIDDNEYFKWSIVRYLTHANHHPARFTKADIDFANKLKFKEIQFSVKIRFTKLKKRIPLVLAFLAMRIKKNIQSTYQKNVMKRNMFIYY